MRCSLGGAPELRSGGGVARPAERTGPRWSLFASADSSGNETFDCRFISIELLKGGGGVESDEANTGNYNPPSSHKSAGCTAARNGDGCKKPVKGIERRRVG